MTGAEILKVTLAEHLFRGDAGQLKKQYHDLARAWHPDANRELYAPQVFKHIKDLYDDACDRMELGIFGCLSRRPFEYGERFIGDEWVTYIFRKEHEAEWLSAAKTLNKLPFGSPAMQESIGKCVPQRAISFNTPDTGMGIRCLKPADSLLLEDVVAHYGEMDPRHVAWIVSSLLNVACYLGWAKISHADISMKNFFISPKTHVGSLLGGWWFARPMGESIKTIPLRTHSILPWVARNSKRAVPETDLELVRATGRELAVGSNIPGQMRKFLWDLSTGIATKDYEQWGHVLRQSFGARRFMNLDLTPEALYPRR